MSDQPKPTTGEQVSGRIWPKGHEKPTPVKGEPTTGEWTEIISQACSEIYAEYKGKSSPNTAPIVERAINAARMAQAHDDRKHWEARVYGLEQQLEREREITDNLREQLAGAVNEHHKVCQQQFAAEREKVQTLVDALTTIREFTAEHESPSWQVAKDALAKVKEGQK